MKKNRLLFDLNKINPLLTASGSIIEIYAKFFIQELKGCTNKEEYEYKKQVLMQMLKSGLDAEKETTTQLGIYDGNAIALLKVLCDLYYGKDTPQIDSIIRAIIDQSIKDKAITRNIERIQNLFNVKQQLANNHLTETSDYLKQQSSLTFDVMRAADSECLNNFLILLQDEIDSNSMYREYFLKIKYDIISHNQTLEDNFINDKIGENFEKASMPSGMSSVLYEPVRIIAFCDFATKQIDDMLDISDEKYVGDVKSGMNARQLFLRANLALLESTAIEILHDDYHRTIESSSYIKENHRDTISTSMISGAFLKAHRDKKRLNSRN